MNEVASRQMRYLRNDVLLRHNEVALRTKGWQNLKLQLNAKYSIITLIDINFTKGNYDD